MYKKQGFSGIEIITVIGIVLLVLIIVIPGIKQAIVYKEFQNEFRDKISVVTEAFQSENVKNHAQAEKAVKEKLVGKYSVSKDCGRKDQHDCFSDFKNKYDLNDYSATRYNTLSLLDGTNVAYEFSKLKCNELNQKVCGEIIFDVNGFKAPNEAGKDVFMLRVVEGKFVTPFKDEE